MSKVRSKARRGFASAAEWPEWTDAHTWELGPEPTDEDRRWHAEQDDDGPAPDDPIWDEWAEEAAHQDLTDRGYRPF
jgi:hypothetical protein